MKQEPSTFFRVFAYKMDNETKFYIDGTLWGSVEYQLDDETQEWTRRKTLVTWDRKWFWKVFITLAKHMLTQKDNIGYYYKLYVKGGDWRAYFDGEVRRVQLRKPD
jgi:hypothetical protein